MPPLETSTARPAYTKAAFVSFMLLIMTICPCFPAQAPVADDRDDAREDLIVRIKHLEKVLGFRHTKNFSHASNKPMAAYRCYYTGKLELPESYEALRLKAGTKDGCSLDPEKNDVFFYPVEAVPFRKTPVTASLARESTERFLVVIPHEDYHESRELRRLPATLTEAASTLMGFLTAREVARAKFGAESEVYRNLSREPELFLRKAEIVNRYHARLSDLYAEVRAGALAPSEALAQKENLFRGAQQACQAIVADPKSFNKCLAANNNAGLAFDRTYTRYYPLMYDLYKAYQEDLRATNEALKQALNARSEAAAVQHLQEITARATEHALLRQTLAAQASDSLPANHLPLR
jgi:hypothetical protein